DPTLAGYTDARAATLYKDLQRELMALPGVTSATWTELAPLSGGLWQGSIRFVGEAKPIDVDLIGAGPDYFATLGQPLIAGVQRPGGVVINEELARLMHAQVGSRFSYTGDDPGPEQEVTGIVRGALFQDLRRAIAPAIYVEPGGRGVTFAARTAGDPERLFSS